MAKKKSRKSASLKEQAVLRLLKGEDMELVSRQTGFAMREHGLLSPQRHEQGEEKKHDGTIIPDSINQLWGN